MVQLKYNCLNNKTIKKIKNRLITKNKTIKNVKFVIKNHIEKYLTTEELYSIDYKNKYNDIVNLFETLSYNQERECKINKKNLFELNKLKNECIDFVGEKNITKFMNIITKHNKQKKILLDIEMEYYIYKEFNSEYFDYKINHFCKDYYLLNVNELSKKYEYFDVQSFEHSPSKQYISFCVDFIGNRNYNLFIKNLYVPNDIQFVNLNKNNEKLVSIHDTMGNLTNKQSTSNYFWIDDMTIIFITYDKYYNSSKCYIYNIKSKKRRCIFESKNNTMIGLQTVLSGFYFLLYSSTYNSDEVYLIDIHEVNLYTHKKKVNLIKEPILKNKPFVKYDYITHINATWYILKKEKQKYSFIKSHDFKSFEVLFEKKEKFITIKDILFIDNFFIFFVQNKGGFYIQFYNLCNKKIKYIKNDLCFLKDSCNLNVLSFFPSKDKLLFYSSSFTNKNNVFELTFDRFNNFSIHQLVNNESNKFNNYHEKTIYLKNNQIMITQIYRKGLKLNNCKCLLYGYGSYGDSYDANFNVNKLLTLCDRGFLVIIAHVSGDGRLGFNQYENGILMKKKNTFDDFIYIIDNYLFRHNITSKDKLVIWGRSAGGLLIGSVINQRPDICNMAILGVPFISPVLTMSSHKNPLGFESHSEWGNPLKQPYKDYIKSYSPYQNINPCGQYPNIFIYSNLNDSLVPYKQPYLYYKKMKETVNVFKNGEKDIHLYIDDKFGHNQGSSFNDYSYLFSIIFSAIEKHIK